MKEYPSEDQQSSEAEDDEKMFEYTTMCAKMTIIM